jgi:uncharacterized protein (DUF1800 family)
MAVRAMGRREDVSLFHRLADADGDRLLTDRDVEEAGQLTGAELLLDMLLEPTDQHHLTEKLAQRFRVQDAFLLDLRHGSGSVRFAS